MYCLQPAVGLRGIEGFEPWVRHVLSTAWCWSEGDWGVQTWGQACTVYCLLLVWGGLRGSDPGSGMYCLLPIVSLRGIERFRPWVRHVLSTAWCWSEGDWGVQTLGQACTVYYLVLVWGGLRGSDTGSGMYYYLMLVWGGLRGSDPGSGMYCLLPGVCLRGIEGFRPWVRHVLSTAWCLSEGDWEVQTLGQACTTTWCWSEGFRPWVRHVLSTAWCLSEGDWGVQTLGQACTVYCLVFVWGGLRGSDPGSGMYCLLPGVCLRGIEGFRPWVRHVLLPAVGLSSSDAYVLLVACCWAEVGLRVWLLKVVSLR